MIYIFYCFKTNEIMKLDLRNSIYSKGYSMGSGLDVQNGRLINNRPDGITGIAEAANSRRIMKRMEKVSVISEGVSLGNIKSDMFESL